MKYISSFSNLLTSLFRLLIDGVPAPFNAKEDIEFRGSEEFRSHYNSFIKKHIIDFENKRIATLAELRSRLMIGAPILILFFFLGVVLLIKGLQIVVGIIVFIGIIVYLWMIDSVEAYKDSIKETIFPEIFKFFGESLSYSPIGKIDVSSLSHSRLFPHFDSNGYTQDHVKGEYKGINFEFLGLRLECYHKKVNNRNVVVFSGLLITLSVNKNFTHSTIIKTDKGALGNWVHEKFSDLERVSLEDVRFEKNFEVYSTDQIEARYLLTTSFMERLLSLAEVFGRDLQASFFSNKLFLIIPDTKVSLSVSSIFTPATFDTEINEILKEVKEVFSVVDTLKLDSKTGL